jgi:hypothetical protein
MKSRFLGAVFSCGLMLFTGTVSAVSVTLSEAGLNFLELQFTVPVQPPEHNALNILVSSSSGPTTPPFSAAASLFDGVNLLAQSQTSAIGERYATAGSFFSGVDPIIDYTTISDGTINGIFTLYVTSGSRTFDTDNFVIRTFGDGGSTGFDGTVTNISVSAVVPIPAALWLFGSGLLGMIAIARRIKTA